MSDSLDANSAIREVAERTANWLLSVAAPLWSSRGRTRTGLFAERMTLQGEADTSYFRTFVQARHVYSFCIAGTLGWNGPWQALVSETMDNLLAKARRDDGFFVHRVDAQAEPLDKRVDLYDQAFVLFALGTAGGALNRSDYFDAAESLLDTLEANWRDPAGGFREGEIVDPRVRRQNPHMHLFEAAQALSAASGRSRFRDLSEEIALLAASRFIDKNTGALLEYFTDELEPAPGVEGRIVEPGHCFEWAWLFEMLARSGWSEGATVSDRLTAFARISGIDPSRGVAINEVLTDHCVHDDKARLWPQTERIKVSIARYRRTNDPDEAYETVRAVQGLEKYLDSPEPGLWRDKLRSDGTWIDEPVPGSSLYHISCAVAELNAIGPHRVVRVVC